MANEVFIKTNILRLQENFAKWMSAIEDNSKAFEMFVPQFQNSRVGWIYAGRTVDGVRMAKLSPKYKKAKEKKYGTQPILIASGDLIKAIRGGSGWEQVIEPKSLEMGIDLDYASYHQDGTAKMPQRNYFLTRDGTLNKMDYAQLLQAMEGKINADTEAILNQTITEMAMGR